MCVIVVKPKGKFVSLETLKKCQEKNPDMFGVSYLYNHRIYTLRGQTDIEKVYKKLCGYVVDISELDVVWHFRIATSGKVNVSNSHPFPLSLEFLKHHIHRKYFSSKHPVLCHNGILNEFGNETYSDTVCLAYMLCKLNYNERLSLLNSLYGNNKFVILSLSGVETIGYFHDVDGILFSNLTWSYEKTNWNNCFYDTKQVWNNYSAVTLFDYSKQTRALPIKDKLSVCSICNRELTEKERQF